MGFEVSDKSTYVFRPGMLIKTYFLKSSENLKKITQGNFGFFGPKKVQKAFFNKIKELKVCLTKLNQLLWIAFGLFTEDHIFLF